MSLWWDGIERPKFSPGSLDQNWDVVIVGGGFSGLWSAYHLLNAQPDLKIAILEKSLVGAGASGRNGGWASALYPVSELSLLRRFSAEAVETLFAHLRGSIDEIGKFIEREKISAQFIKGGTLLVARNQAQLDRLKSERDPRSILLEADETLARIGMQGALGSTFNPHCASLNPAQLVVGLARSLEKRGVAIFENTLVEISNNKKVFYRGNEISSRFALRAIEAYHANNREQIPIYSLMIATQPLPDEAFKEIALHNRETFAEVSHLVNYAQRTADNRLAIGGRGAAYSMGSRRNESRESNQKIHGHLQKMARQWFPILKDYQFTHAWGGAVGVTRDWSPFLRWDGKYGEMGGYAGDGLTLSYLTASTAAALILEESPSDRASLPFVQWKSPRWEIEPLRWLGINAGIKLTKIADWEEKKTDQPSRMMRHLAPIFGLEKNLPTEI